MLALQQYSSDEDNSDHENKDHLEDLTAHLRPINQQNAISSTIQLKAAPEIFTKVWHHILKSFQDNLFPKILICILFYV